MKTIRTLLRKKHVAEEVKYGPLPRPGVGQYRVFSSGKSAPAGRLSGSAGRRLTIEQLAKKINGLNLVWPTPYSARIGEHRRRWSEESFPVLAIRHEYARPALGALLSASGFLLLLAREASRDEKGKFSFAAALALPWVIENEAWR